MRLIPNWRRVLARAWSLRFIAVSGLLDGIALVVTVIGPNLPISPAAFTACAIASQTAAALARVIAQPKTIGETDAHR